LAIFTAIATSIVAAIGITGTLATIATAFVAAGLAIGTAKILGVMDTPKAGQDPGVKVQLPPATDNKVPRLYGRNFAGGTIVDAEIKNQNKTMAYCIVLSDMSNIYDETWSINDIYRGDSRLNFTGIAVSSQLDTNNTSTNSVANKIRCRVYAGGSSSAYQIFPTSGAANAYGGTDNSKSAQFKNWTSSNTMTDLVFAIVEIDYDPENDLTGLGVFTFDIETNLKNPSKVLVDYLNNERYGMGNVNFPVTVSGSTVTPLNINTTSLTEWNDYAETNSIMINGGLSTFDTVKVNVNKICMSGGSFFTYNNKTGNFGVVVNTAANAAVQANAYVLSDDNLVGALGVTSTDLFSMYNQMEVEFPSVIQRDQTDTVFLETPSAQRNINEPDNKLNVRFDLTNDRQVAINLANIDLRQGRYTTVVTAKGDYTTLPIDVGDIVKVNNEVFDWEEKLFRVMQTKEVETAESMIYNELTLLEYDDSIYTWTTESPSANIGLSGISNWWNTNTNPQIVVGNVFVGDNVVYGSNVTGYDPETGAITSNTVTIDNLLSTSNSSIGNTNPVVGFPVYVPENVTYDTLEVTYTNSNKSNVGSYDSKITDTMKPPAGESYFPADTTVWYTRDVSEFSNLNGGDDYELTMRMKDSGTGAASVPVTTAPIPINVQNTVDNKKLATFGAGGQFTETISSVEVANSTVFANIAAQSYDLTGVEPGIYSIDSSAVVGGLLTAPTYDAGFRTNVRVSFANTTNTQSIVFAGGGYTISGADNPPPPLIDNNEVIMDAKILNPIFPTIAADMLPVSANVWSQGYTTLDSNVSTTRQFGDVKHDMFKITSSER